MIEDKDFGKIMRRAVEKHLDGNEIKMLAVVALNLDARNSCTKLNKELAVFMGDEKGPVSESSITNWLSSLKAKGVVNIIQNSHSHRRHVYIRGLEDLKYRIEPDFEDMSEAQRKFKMKFPNRNIDCDVPDNVDMDALLAEIELSSRLMKWDNMSLKSVCIRHYKAIMAGAWRDEPKQVKASQLMKVAKNLKEQK